MKMLNLFFIFKFPIQYSSGQPLLLCDTIIMNIVGATQNFGITVLAVIVNQGKQRYEDMEAKDNVLWQNICYSSVCYSSNHSVN